MPSRFAPSRHSTGRVRCAIDPLEDGSSRRACWWGASPVYKAFKPKPRLKLYTAHTILKHRNVRFYDENILPDWPQNGGWA